MRDAAASLHWPHVEQERPDCLHSFVKPSFATSISAHSKLIDDPVDQLLLRLSVHVSFVQLL